MQRARWIVPIVLVVAACSSSATDGAPPSVDDAAWIVYQSPQGLRRVLPTGFNQIPALSTMATESLHADFSRDGQRLAFNVDSDDGTRDVWTSGWDGADPKLLVDCVEPCRDADSPAWSPDGSTIAFTRIDNVDGHNPGSSLQMVDVKSGLVSTVFATEGVEYLSGARWSPDGQSMVATLERYIDDGNDTTEVTGRAIVLIHLDRSPVSMDVLRPYEDFASYPDWHPTKDLLVFEMSGSDGDPLDPAEPPQNVYTMKPDGSDVTQVTKQTADDDDAYWMATFRTDGDGILATKLSRPRGDLTVVQIAMDGTVSNLLDGSVVSGAHPRQRPPVG